MKEMHVRVGSDVCHDDFAVYVAAYDEKGNRFLPDKMELSLYDEPWGNHSPMLRIQKREAQRLIDDLWACGLRPTEGSGSAGSLAATQKHLEDMRHIAMEALKSVGVMK